MGVRCTCAEASRHIGGQRRVAARGLEIVPDQAARLFLEDDERSVEYLPRRLERVGFRQPDAGVVQGDQRGKLVAHRRSEKIERAVDAQGDLSGQNPAVAQLYEDRSLRKATRGQGNVRDLDGRVFTQLANQIVPEGQPVEDFALRVAACGESLTLSNFRGDGVLAGLRERAVGPCELLQIYPVAPCGSDSRALEQYLLQARTRAIEPRARVLIRCTKHCVRFTRGSEQSRVLGKQRVLHSGPVTFVDDQLREHRGHDIQPCTRRRRHLGFQLHAGLAQGEQRLQQRVAHR